MPNILQPTLFMLFHYIVLILTLKSPPVPKMILYLPFCLSAAATLTIYQRCAISIVLLALGVACFVAKMEQFAYFHVDFLLAYFQLGWF